MSRRWDWRYGACGPPTSGPSSQSIPSHRSESITPWKASSVTREASVSSIRRTNTPPWCRANAHENSPVRAFPTWIDPDGAGANRVRTPTVMRSPPRHGSRALLHGVNERADPVDLNLDEIAGRERADPLRGPGEDHVTRQQRHEGRDVLDQRRDAEHHLARLSRLADLAVHARLDPHVVGVQVGLDPRPQRARPVEPLRASPLVVGLL